MSEKIYDEQVVLKKFEVDLVTDKIQDTWYDVMRLTLASEDQNFLSICNDMIAKDYLSLLDNELAWESFERLNSETVGIRDHHISLFLGIAALQEFVRCNWTGPKQNVEKEFSSLHRYISRDDALSELSSGHETVYHHVILPELLVLSKSIFDSISDHFIHTKNWWLLRCFVLQQHILFEKSSHLYQEMNKLVEKLLFFLSNDSTKVQCNVECGIFNLYYDRVKEAKMYIDNAFKFIGVDVELCGAFGKRTRYQSKPVAQLYVQLNRSLNYDEQDELDVEVNVPKDVVLKDDVLLSKIMFIDEDSKEILYLLPEEQVAVLAQCCLVQKLNASDELLAEQLMAYVECLLGHPTTWCIQMKSLIFRSKLEKGKSRKVERAMVQLECLIDEIRSDKPMIGKRQHLFYSTFFPPYWHLEKEMADLLISLGAVKSALDVYLRLELWEDVVKCYQLLNQNSKAAEIVHEKLKEGETPLLWCILGDVTDDVSCYFKAVEISPNGNARAYRSIGYHHYKKGDYIKSIPFFEDSLNINHLQTSVWFSLAFAYNQAENYDSAAKAYREVVNFDNDNFEAWNNLSNAYIKTNQKPRAHKVLQEALRCNYEDWRIWENYLLVSLDIGAFDDAIQAIHRILDIKMKYKDSEVLSILVKAVTSNVIDNSGEPASRLKQRVLELFGRVTSIIPNNSTLWKLYASIHSSEPNYLENKELLERVLNYRQKALNYGVQQSGWEKNAALCQSILMDAKELGETYIPYLEMLEESTRLKSKGSIKLTLKNVLIRVEKFMGDHVNKDAEELEALTIVVKDIISTIELI